MTTSPLYNINQQFAYGELPKNTDQIKVMCAADAAFIDAKTKLLLAIKSAIKEGRPIDHPVVSFNGNFNGTPDAKTFKGSNGLVRAARRCDPADVTASMKTLAELPYVAAVFQHSPGFIDFLISVDPDQIKTAEDFRYAQQSLAQSCLGGWVCDLDLTVDLRKATGWIFKSKWDPIQIPKPMVQPVLPAAAATPTIVTTPVVEFEIPELSAKLEAHEQVAGIEVTEQSTQFPIRPEGDFITILEARPGKTATKTFTPDEVRSYDAGAYFRVSYNPVNGIESIAGVLVRIQNESGKFAIRGALKPLDQIPPNDNKGNPTIVDGRLVRQQSTFKDVSHHWGMVDVDGYEPDGIDPVQNPEAAVEQFISNNMPSCFHDVSFYWQLSSSAGQPGNERKLKAHIWFWLSQGLTSNQLREWAASINEGRDKADWIDKSVFATVQPHYTANPIFEGVSDPVPSRSGLALRANSEVDLVLSSETLRVAQAATDRVGMKLADPRKKIGLIGKFHRVFTVEQVLERFLQEEFEFAGGDNRRLNWLKDGDTGAEGAFIGSDRMHITNVHDKAPSSGIALNLFDVVRVYKFGHLDQGVPDETKPQDRPSFKAALDWAKGLPEMQDAIESKYLEQAEEIKTGIVASITKILRPNPEIKELISEAIKTAQIAQIIRGSFWNANVKAVFMLHDDGDGHDNVIQCSAQDFGGFCDKNFGAICNHAIIDVLAEEAKVAKGDRTAIRNIPKEAVLLHLKMHNQRNALEYKVDPFALDNGRMEILDSKARAVLRLHYFNETPFNEEIINDFREHFPELDEVLNFIAHARFAHDRKKAFLWLWAPSDWGKNLFMSVLKDLEASVEISVKEIEAALEGKPVGLKPEAFTRALALVVDEFKTVRSELKQLQSEMSLAPKFQMSSKVELFAKIFMSAESVDSLVSSSGVEDQFANRMAMIKGIGAIESREVFVKYGKAKYQKSLVGYAAKFFNARFSALIDLGLEEANRIADDFITRFNLKYGLKEHFGVISDDIGRIAEEIIEGFVREQSIHYSSNMFKITTESDLPFGVNKDCLIMKRPQLLINKYIEANYTHSEKPMLLKKSKDILKAMTADADLSNKPIKCKITDKSIKGIRVKQIHSADEKRLFEFLRNHHWM